MTLLEALNEKRPVAEIPTTELTATLAAYVAGKVWRGRYFELDKEVQRRASARWVHEDVFGNTFAPLSGPLA